MFFEVGASYKPNKLQSFSKKPILTFEINKSITENESFIVLEVISRPMSSNDEALLMSKMEISKSVVNQIKLLFDNQILYLCFLNGSGIDTDPNSSFTKIC